MADQLVSPLARQYRAVLDASKLQSGSPIIKQAGSLAADSQPSYSTIRQVLARTYRNEGFRGFYKGLGTNLVRIAPGASLTLLVYERMSVSIRAFVVVKRALAENIMRVYCRYCCASKPRSEALPLNAPSWRPRGVLLRVRLFSSQTPHLGQLRAGSRLLESVLD